MTPVLQNLTFLTQSVPCLVCQSHLTELITLLPEAFCLLGWFSSIILAWFFSCHSHSLLLDPSHQPKFWMLKWVWQWPHHWSSSHLHTLLGDFIHHHGFGYLCMLITSMFVSLPLTSSLNSTPGYLAAHLTSPHSHLRLYISKTELTSLRPAGSIPHLYGWRFSSAVAEAENRSESLDSTFCHTAYVAH